MKKINIIISSLLLAGGLHAQTIYDAERIMGSELNGTARFVGMGGAMGALGGDISTMGTNPAGIGIYRSNDFMTSFGFNTTVTQSNSPNDGDIKSKTTKMSYDNIGFVYTTKIGNVTPLRYVNFGFNYRKIKNFNKSMWVNGIVSASQTDQMAHLTSRDYDYITHDNLVSRDAYFYNDVPWLGVLGYRAHLIDPHETINGKYVGYRPDSSVDNLYRSRTEGGVNAYDFNMALNFNDRFYVGATLGVYDVDYWMASDYNEIFLVEDSYYDLHTRYSTTGAGIDFKLGFIARPLADSPLRIGLAVHTPTFFQLKDRNYAELYHNNYDTATGDPVSGWTFTEDARGEEMDMKTDYRLITPWKLNASLGYTIDNNIALGFEYEFMDYSTAKLRRDREGVITDMVGENSMMKSMMKSMHTLKFGVEARIVPQFSVRAGYNFITSPYKEDAYKELPLNSIMTDTSFSNSKSMNNVTFGLGYRGNVFYADLAYQYSFYKADFYAFDSLDLPATTVNNDRHQLLMTLGVRF